MRFPGRRKHKSTMRSAVAFMTIAALASPVALANVPEPVAASATLLPAENFDATGTRMLVLGDTHLWLTTGIDAEGSTDGKTWKHIKLGDGSSSTFTLTEVGTTLFAAGWYGVSGTFRSTNAGATWTKLEIPKTKKEGISSITAGPGGIYARAVAYAFGDQYYWLRSTDNGDTWQRAEEAPTFTRAIDNELWRLDGRARYSNDRGTTWIETPLSRVNSVVTHRGKRYLASLEGVFVGDTLAGPFTEIGPDGEVEELWVEGGELLARIIHGATIYRYVDRGYWERIVRPTSLIREPVATLYVQHNQRFGTWVLWIHDGRTHLAKLVVSPFTADSALSSFVDEFAQLRSVEIRNTFSCSEQATLLRDRTRRLDELVWLAGKAAAATNRAEHLARLQEHVVAIDRAVQQCKHYITAWTIEADATRLRSLLPAR